MHRKLKSSIICAAAIAVVVLLMPVAILWSASKD